MAEKTSTGLDLNLANALCYAPFVGWIAAIVLFIVEKNKQIRWHAVHGLLVSLAIGVVGWVLAMTLILAILSPLVWVGGLVLQLVLAVKAYQGQGMKLPLVTAWTDQISKKF